MENHFKGTSNNSLEPIKISDLVVNTEVRGWLLVEETLNRTTKHGKPYRHIKLRDQRGNEIAGCQFDLPQREINPPQAGRVALIKGQVEEYLNSLRIKLAQVELDETAPQDIFVVGTRQNIDKLEEQFWKLASSCATS